MNRRASHQMVGSKGLQVGWLDGGDASYRSRPTGGSLAASTGRLRAPCQGTVFQWMRTPPGELSFQPVAIGAVAQGAKWLKPL